MNFQIHALDPTPFAQLSGLTTDEMSLRRAIWVEADSEPGYPCRVSLEDAPMGTRLLLINYDHQPVDSPYRSSHAIYVNPQARQAHPAPGAVPSSIASRLISWRAFNSQHLMVEADVVDGNILHQTLIKTFEQEHIAYVHLHNARPGCYAARATRC